MKRSLTKALVIGSTALVGACGGRVGLDQLGPANSVGEDGGANDKSDSGAPLCAAGESICGGACVAIESDPDHCGACETKCGEPTGSAGTACVSGRCIITSCDSGRADCDHDPSNGCEADLSSAATCGACDIACDASRICEVDATTRGACIVPSAPHLVAPLSLSNSSTRRPLFRWTTAQSVASFSLDLCNDRACTNPIAANVAVATDSYRPTSDLPTGVVFWRVHAIDENGSVSPTWEVRIGPRTAAVETHWGEMSDFDGDGISDAVDVGSSNFYVHGRSNEVPPAQPLSLPVEGTYAANAGDVDGDGYADLFLYRDFVGYLLSGRELGSAAQIPTVIASPMTNPAEFGTAGTAAGDVDGDGYADLIVNGSDPSSNVWLYVYAGSAEGIPATPTQSLSYSLPGGGIGGYAHLAGVGDINGDGYADVVGIMAGSLVVYYGSATGLVDSSGFIDGGFAFGSSLAAVGDINGDGYEDFAVGANDAQKIFLFLGSATGVDTDATHAQTFVGKTVFGGGDVDGDGFSDLVFSVDGYSTDNIVRGSQTTLVEDPTAFTFSYDLRVADLKSDGRADLLGLTNTGLQILLGAPYSSTSAPETYKPVGDERGGLRSNRRVSAYRTGDTKQVTTLIHTYPITLNAARRLSDGRVPAAARCRSLQCTQSTAS